MIPPLLWVKFSFSISSIPIVPPFFGKIKSFVSICSFWNPHFWWWNPHSFLFLLVKPPLIPMKPRYDPCIVHGQHIIFHDETSMFDAWITHLNPPVFPWWNPHPPHVSTSAGISKLVAPGIRSSTLQRSPSTSRSSWHSSATSWGSLEVSPRKMGKKWKNGRFDHQRWGFHMVGVSHGWGFTWFI